MISVSIYAFAGLMSKDVGPESDEVHCLSAILSEQDLESVAGLSARAVQVVSHLSHDAMKCYLQGFRLTSPNLSKEPRPKRRL